MTDNRTEIAPATCRRILEALRDIGPHYIAPGHKKTTIGRRVSDGAGGINTNAITFYTLRERQWIERRVQGGPFEITARGLAAIPIPRRPRR